MVALGVWVRKQMWLFKWVFAPLNSSKITQEYGAEKFYNWRLLWKQQKNY